MDKIVDRTNLIRYHNSAVKPLRNDLQTLAGWAVEVDNTLSVLGADTCPDRYIDELINS